MVSLDDYSNLSLFRESSRSNYEEEYEAIDAQGAAAAAAKTGKRKNNKKKVIAQNDDMITPGGPDEEEKRDIDSEIEFLREIFPNFDIPVIRKVFEEKSKFDEAFKHLQEFFELVATNEM